MPGEPIKLGPFTEGLHNSAGTGEYIKDKELYELVNLEVDTDGSLANRPAIVDFSVSSSLAALEYYIIGVYYLENGNTYLVVSYKTTSTFGVALIDIVTGSVAKTQEGFTDFCVAGIQYFKKYYVYGAPGTTDVAGNFDESFTWTQAALPGGQASSCAIYNERLFATPGVKATDNKSRLYFSAIADPTSFTGTDYIDIEPGNGESLVYLSPLTNNLLLFKEHSTYRLSFSSSILKVQISSISGTIGCPRENCAVVYGNNSVYVLHDNSVYELYNFNYTKISSGLRFEAKSAPGMKDPEKPSLTLSRDRLFIRYYNDLYVYSLLSGKWSSWQSTKLFREVLQVDGPDGDITFSASINSDRLNEIYKFTNNRVTGVDTEETFTCKITTKTYDFDVSHVFKVMFWWGITIATLGDTRVQMVSPNAGAGYRWDDFATTTWDQLLLDGIKWSSANPVVQKSTVPSEIGAYSRKSLRFPKKTRFRQAFFTIETDAKPNDTGDAAVRMYDVTVLLKPKETVVKRTTA